MKKLNQTIWCLTLTTIMIIGMAACQIGHCAEKSLELTKSGKPNSVIIIAASPTKSTQMAALEIQHHIKLISGAEIPIFKIAQLKKYDKRIQIIIGPSAATEKLGLSNKNFDREEYLIKFYSDKIVILGKDQETKGIVNLKKSNSWPSQWDENGTLRGAYDFLRRYCGVRWFNTTSLGTDVPEEPTLVVTGNMIQRKPFLRYRGGFAGWSRTQCTTTCWNRKQEGYKEWGKLAFPQTAQKDGDRPLKPDDYFKLFVLRQGGGGELSQCNHNVGHLYHRYWESNPKHGGEQVFIEKRPQYFAQHKGDKPCQPNFLSNEVVKITADDARRYFDTGHVLAWKDENGKKKYLKPAYCWGKNFYALEPNDGGGFCISPAAQAMYKKNDPSGKVSNYWFSFVNKVAKEVKKTHPNKKISVLAYGSHEAPPDFPLEDNIVVHFCYSANRMPYDKKSNEKQLNNLKQWIKKGNPMYLWLYNTFPREKAQNGKFYMFPGFFAHTLANQIKYFNKIDIQGIFHCGWGEEVENYLTYRLMDDPDLDVDQLLDEYFTRMYGKAAQPIKKMYTLIEQTYCDPKNYPPNATHQDTSIAWGHLGTPERMKKLEKLIKQAHELAKTDLEKKRVALWDQSVYQFMVAGRKQYDFRQSFPIPSITALRIPDANGNPTKIDWNKTTTMVKNLYLSGSDTPVKTKVTGKVCHDGKYLYLRLVDHGDPDKLNISPMIAPFDDWEIFMSRQRSQPFRQYMVGPTAMKWGFSWGEVNWRQCVPASESGTDKCFNMKAYSNTSDDAWVLDLVFPLKDITDKPLSPGDTFYCNLIRVRSPKQTGKSHLQVETWVSHMTVKEIDRAAKIKLAK